jgi:hypothetical protein
LRTLACGHVAYAGRRRVCPHMLRPAEDEDVAYVRLLTGRGIDADLCGFSANLIQSHWN